jgi:chromosome segregation ATPase
MRFSSRTAGLRLALSAALIVGALGLAVPSQAAKLGPYFPIPNGFNLNGVPRDALLNIQASWLKNGLDRLEKARKETEDALEKAKGGAQDQVAGLETKLKDIDKQIEDTKAEIAIASDTTPGEAQKARKDKLLTNVNQWINELEHMATEQMKIAIMSDGGVAMTAEKMNQQYSQFADDLQHAKRDASVENWGK